MTADLLFNAILAGILLGGFYAAVTVGVSISFGILDIVNIAHPAFIILGSYIAYIVNQTLGLDPILTSIIVLPVFYALGAAIYQVYVRSFCDGNGDGQGDFAGLISKLDYIHRLGVDAVWLSPIHQSPNRDWGYDVSDFTGFHPDYGSLDDFHALLKSAHDRGLKIILDEVLAHTSDEHAWFTASRDGDADKRDWYVWADPRDDGTVPNNWLSVFGGPAWSY